LETKEKGIVSVLEHEQVEQHLLLQLMMIRVSHDDDFLPRHLHFLLAAAAVAPQQLWGTPRSSRNWPIHCHLDSRLAEEKRREETLEMVKLFGKKEGKTSQKVKD
jgi:hypothetical protein